MRRGALLLAVVLCACGPDWAPLQGEHVRTVTVLEVAGLYTNQAELSQVPQGGMREADNVVFRRPGICETRPGREAVPGAYSEASTPRALTTYGGYLVAWFANNKLARYDFNTQTWTSYSGTFTPPYSLPRVRFMESGGTLYVTTSAGIYRLDEPTADWKLAGVEGSIQSTATLPAAAGFLPNNKAVAYRTHWGRVDANDVLLRGPPGPRLVVQNTAGATRNVQLRNYIPVNIDTNHFLQIHRTQDVDVGIDPGEEMAQVAEVFPTPTDITNQFLDYLDQTPDELRGPSLYTATEQALQSEQRPPIAADMVAYNGHTIYARTQGLQTLTVTLLGAGSTPGIIAGEGFSLTGVGTVIYTGAVAESPPTDFQVYTTGTASQNLQNTVESICRIISTDPLGEWYAEPLGTDAIGSFVIRSRSLSAQSFIMTSYGSTDHWIPAMYSVLTVNPGQLSRAANVVTVNATTPHGLSVGQQVTHSSSSGFSPNGTKTVSNVVDFDTFQYAEVGANGVDGQPSAFVTTWPQPVSQPDGASNAYSWSQFEQPDAAPLANTDVVGTPGSAILRVIKVGSATFFVKPEGLYRLFGSTPENWSLEAWDETRKFLAPETVVVTGGVAYAMTTEGYVRWTENSKPEPASFNIEPTIRDLIIKAKTEVDTYGWAAVNERDRELYLGLPSAAGDTSATQLFVYNWGTKEQAWARWPVSTYIGHASSVDGRLYLSRPGDTQLRRLRGAGTSADYQDESGEAIQSRVIFIPQIGGSPELEKQWTEVEFYFNGSSPSGASAVFSSEQATAEVSVALDAEDGDRPGILRASPDIEHARATALTLGITHGVALEKMELMGYSATIRSAYRARR